MLLCISASNKKKVIQPGLWHVRYKVAMQETCCFAYAWHLKAPYFMIIAAHERGKHWRKNHEHKESKDGLYSLLQVDKQKPFAAIRNYASLQYTYIYIYDCIKSPLVCFCFTHYIYICAYIYVICNIREREQLEKSTRLQLTYAWILNNLRSTFITLKKRKI